ncbi:hypothetical protein GQ42DRAFT_72075 [Ramicandelaber brevisporus]|nr:hypothetical protein GQ42DRAFT_72075 [Ramicandelaber brevisporus]
MAALVTDNSDTARNDTDGPYVLILHTITKPSDPGVNDHTSEYRYCLVEFADRLVASRVQGSVLTSAGLSTSRAGHAVVLVNPFSGTHKSLSSWREVVRPMLDIAGVTYNVVETTHKGHAAEVAQTLDIEQTRAIITVSGDGLLHEVMNGLARHTADPEKALRTIPLGAVPCGTSNGIAKSVHSASVHLATFAAIRGHTIPLDVMQTTDWTGRTELCNLTILWGLIADVDIESEYIRWAGFTRNYLWAIVRILALRRYYGKLHYYSAEQSVPSNASIVDKIDISNGVSQLPDGWHTVDADRFTFVAAMNLPFLAEDAVLSPRETPSSGTLDLVWAGPDITRLDVLGLLVDNDNAKRIGVGPIKLQSVRAFILEPLGLESPAVDPARFGQDRSCGILDFDGEEVPCGPIKVEVLPGHVQLLVPPWYTSGN